MLTIKNNMKKRLLYGGCCLIILLLLLLITGIMKSGLYDQQAAKRWSNDGGYAQISCFFPVSTVTDEYYFLNLEHTIEQALTTDSIAAENENAKLFIDAVSTSGNINVESENASMNVKTIGVTDSFFSFHPVALLGGSYFSDEMLMKDGILIDEDAAWQLFGSNDVVGMEVTIDGIPYYVRGVIDREEGHFADAAGLKESVCYVSLDTLTTHGNVSGSYTFEIVLPNPVDQFAMQTITTALHDDEKTIQVVENSSRFQFMPLWQVIRDFGIRSMNQQEIVYPYWENIARAYEDIFAVFMVIKIFLIANISIILFFFLREKWKQKKWTVKSVMVSLKNGTVKMMQSRRALRKGKKEKKK